MCCYHPCYQLDSPDVILRIFPEMLEPIPRRSAECVCLVLPQPSSAFPIIRMGRLTASIREHDFPRVGFRDCSYFLMFRVAVGTACCPLPPAQTRAGAANAHGSYLGCLAAKRTLG